jgi:hypothetical protein
MSFMLTVLNVPFMLSVFMPSVVMVSVVAPIKELQRTNALAYLASASVKKTTNLTALTLKVQNMT